MARALLFLLTLLFGAWFGFEHPPKVKKEVVKGISPEKEYPVLEHKSFVIVLYAYNQEFWCKKALESIFEQDYDHYRVIVIDDASQDQTYDVMQEFIVDNNQDDKVLLMQNETKEGLIGSLYRSIDHCLDREIVIPFLAKDRFSSPLSLARLNIAYQNPDVWCSFAKGLNYPSYESSSEKYMSFYAALFKEIELKDLLENGAFTKDDTLYCSIIEKLSGGRCKTIEEPIALINQAAPMRPVSALKPFSDYSPLSSFPKEVKKGSAGICILSDDHPLELFACLESIQRYCTGFDALDVIYSASSELINLEYQKVKNAFPKARFLLQKKGVENSFTKYLSFLRSDYLLFLKKDMIVKDHIDFRYCLDQLKKAKASGLYLHLGRHISHASNQNIAQEPPKGSPVALDLYAWDLSKKDPKWDFKDSCFMTLCSKEQLLTQDKKGIGLYFAFSKIGQMSMGNLSDEEVLVKAQEGLKINIEPLYKIENSSPRFEFAPEFIPIMTH